jgi:tRNA modification GTPase
VSGDGAFGICDAVFRADGGGKAADFPERRLMLGTFSAAAFDERCLAVCFTAPRSFTGENVVEFQIHGGAALARYVLAALLSAGAVTARPGEFTERAFINGKTDLSGAEGIIRLINAQSEAELRAAGALADGKLYRLCAKMQDLLTDMLAELETSIDFPDSDAEAGGADTLSPRVREIAGTLTGLLATGTTAAYVRDGINIVLAGKPNVGKSALLNALLKAERAIVAELPGTTRDTITETLIYKGVKMNVTDTAGLRDGADAVEKLGVERARTALSSADIVLRVTDPADDSDDGKIDGALAGKKALSVRNKSDIKSGGRLRNGSNTPPADICVSALTGAGIEELKERIYTEFIDGGVIAGGLMLTETRHLDALSRAADALKNPSGIPELLAEDLRSAWLCLGEITGSTASEEVVDRIFERFCLGK